MADMLGIVTLLMVALITLIIAVRVPAIRFALAVAFAVRATVALFHFYVAPLPDGTADAVAFERYAWEWGRDGLLAALPHFPGQDAYFYAWAMALVYALTDRSLLMLQSINIFAGVLAIWVAWKLTLRVWDAGSAQRAAWVMALFPTIVQYGALPMREAGFVLFFLLALYWVVDWQQEGGVRPALTAIAFFILGAFFHGGAFIGLVGFVGYAGLWHLHYWLRRLYRYHLNLRSTVLLVLLTILAAAFITTGLSIQKLGTAQEMVSFERWLTYFENYTRGTAQYPQWLTPENPLALIWVLPLRAFYLLLSPLPWDISRPQHLIGLLDGVLYLGLLILTWRNRIAIWRNPSARALLFVLLPLVVAFGVGTSNFGAAVRHRAKLVGAIVVLVAPLLPRLVLAKKSNKPLNDHRSVAVDG